jgi:trk system potassium uptake protein
VVGTFLLVIFIGTTLLSLPIATESGEFAPLRFALVSTVASVCVAGLMPVDVGTYWSGFGETVILLLMQIGGLGVMTISTFIAIAFTKRLSLGNRSAVEIESTRTAPDNLRYVLRRVILFTLAVESILAIWLFSNFHFRYGQNVGDAVWNGLFHSVSVFNNAGISLFSDSLMRFSTDSLILFPMMIAIILGGIGFPVVFELARNWQRPSSWSILTKLSVWITAILIIFPTFGFWHSESDNLATIAKMSGPEQFMSSLFMAITSRTAGFNSVDTISLESESKLLSTILMFIGSGSAGTGGGIKTTTLGVLLFIVLAEVLNRPDVVIGRRRVSQVIQRQALSVFFISTTTVFAFTFLLLALTPFTLEAVLFETVSAFSTTGLSVGIFTQISDPAIYALALLMLIGKIGPLIVATSLALNARTQLSRVPEERVIIG